MSSNNQMAPWQQAIVSAERKFNDIVTAGGVTSVNYQSEAMFAMQLVAGSGALQKCDAGSLRNSVVNIASIGLSLNPANKHAYLVPRGGKCCLDISYIGLSKLATDTGGVRYVCAEVVRENDHFQYKGKDEKPVHEFNPFGGGRGEPVGVYCYVRLADGTYLTEIMTEAEVEFIRKTYAAGNSGAWTKHWDEQAKKTVIKRASKLWPKTSPALREAIHVLNENDGGIPADGSQARHYEQPRRKSEPAGETVEAEYEEVPDTNGAPPDIDTGSDNALTQGHIQLLEAKLQAAKLTAADLFKAFEVDGWDALLASQVNDCLEWVASV